MDTEGGLKSHSRWVQFDLFCILGLSLGFITSLAYWVGSLEKSNRWNMEAYSASGSIKGAIELSDVGQTEKEK